MESIPIGSEPSKENVVPLRSDADEVPDEESMSYEEALEQELPPLDAESTQKPRPNEDTAAMLSQALKVGLGLAVTATNVVGEQLRAAKAREDGVEPTREGGPEPVALFTGASLGMALQMADLAGKVFEAAADVVDPVASWLASPPLLRGAADTAGGVVRLLDGKWQAEQAISQRAAEAFVRGLVPEITRTILDQIDFEAVVDQVPIETILDHVDVDDVIKRVDLDAVVQRIDVNEIAERLDLNAVASGIDVDAVVARVDLDAIVSRIDVAGLAQEVIDDIDLPEIIRESSGSMASETVQEIRVLSINADRFVARLVDRILRRRTRREVAVHPRREDG